MQCNVLRDDEKIDVLYGEASPEAAARVREHVRSCAACRDELSALGRARQRLRSWTLSESPRAQAPRRFLHWALPVAATALLALGGALFYQGSEVRYEDGRIAFRIGVPEDQAFRQMLAEQEARHAREMADLRAALSAAPAAAPAAGTQVRLAQVQELIRESEARQGQRFLARLEELRERTDAQRRIDMARVSAGLSYLDGKNGQQMARTSELMNTMLQASYKR
jgi:hypothetical protein